MGRRTCFVHRNALAEAGVRRYAGKITLIDTRTRRAIAQIKVGAYPVAAAIAG